nr:hypothetical protein [Neobacillus sp. Marseille-Q6967]
MANDLWLTPEEVMRRKKIKNKLMYISVILGTIILSSIVTILANQI